MARCRSGSVSWWAPVIPGPPDAVVRITTTNICGSDLHMYEGRTSVEDGKVLATRTWALSKRSAPE